MNTAYDVFWKTTAEFNKASRFNVQFIGNKNEEHAILYLGDAISKIQIVGKSIRCIVWFLQQINNKEKLRLEREILKKRGINQFYSALIT